MSKKKSKITKLPVETKSVELQDKIMTQYDDVVNNKKFLVFANVLINVLRHLITSIIYSLSLFVIAGVTTNLAITFVDSSMTKLAFLSEDLRMIFTTSYVTAILVALLFKSRLYKNYYMLISKVLPFLKDDREVK